MPKKINLNGPTNSNKGAELKLFNIEEEEIIEGAQYRLYPIDIFNTEFGEEEISEGEIEEDQGKTLETIHFSLKKTLPLYKNQIEPEITTASENRNEKPKQILSSENEELTSSGKPSIPANLDKKQSQPFFLDKRVIKVHPRKTSLLSPEALSQQEIFKSKPPQSAIVERNSGKSSSVVIHTKMSAYAALLSKQKKDHVQCLSTSAAEAIVKESELWASFSPKPSLHHIVSAPNITLLKEEPIEKPQEVQTPELHRPLSSP